MLDDARLLRRYTQRRDEHAFAELVTRHVNVVYSAALRQTDGDAHLAQDVAQTVFTDLARKAESLAQSLERGKPLIGWLYTSTRFAASRLRRTEQRRQSREKVAHAMNEALEPAHAEPEPVWSDLRPLLDDAMSELADADRDAVLLRYFDGKDLRGVGSALGLSEDAARKRVGRALDQLRGLLAARGIKTTGAALSVALSAHAVQIAPGGLATSLTRASLAGAALKATTAVSTFGFIALMTTNVKIIISTAAGILLIGTVAYRANRQPQHEEVAGAMNSGPNTPASPTVLNRGTTRTRPKPAPQPPDPAVEAALARIRAALANPGRAPKYPQPEMEQAIAELGAQRSEAVPILRDALHDPQWEVRRRAASGLNILNGDARDAAPDLIEMLREAPTSQDAWLADTALESIGVKADVIPDLINVMRENPEARTMVANLIPSLVKEGSKEALDAADRLRPLLYSMTPTRKFKRRLAES